MKLKFYPVIFALFFALFLQFTQASAQSLINGTFPGASESLLANRYRNMNFANTNSTQALFAGVSDLDANSGSRVNQDLTYGNSGSFTFTITYNSSANTLTTVTTTTPAVTTVFSNVSSKLISAGKTASANSINLISLVVKTQNNNSSVVVSGLTIKGTNIAGTYGRTNAGNGSSNWHYISSNLNNGFVVSGTVTMSGSLGSGVEGQLVELVFGNTPTIAAASLPVVWGGFNSSRINSSAALLEWRTMQEENTSHYNVQRSVDGIRFQTIGIVAAQGTTASVSDYRFTDKNATASVYYYRLEQVDLDSKLNYSAIIKQGNSSNQTLVGGLGSNKIMVQFFTNEPHQIRIVNNSGVIIKQMNVASQQQTIDVNNMTTGVYALQIINNDGSSEVHRFIK